MRRSSPEKQSSIVDRALDFLKGYMGTLRKNLSKKRERTSVVLSGEQHASDMQENDREALIRRGRRLSEEYSKIEKNPKQSVSTPELNNDELEAIRSEFRNLGKDGRVELFSRFEEEEGIEVMGDDFNLSSNFKERLEALRELREHAKQARDKLKYITETTASKMGGKPKVADIKGSERAMKKILTHYKGRSQKLVDLARSTVLVKSENEAYAVIAELHDLEDKDIVIVRLKDRFITEKRGAYKDINMNLEFEIKIDDQIHIAEMQINTHNFNEAKEIETPFYNRRRDLEDEIKHWKQQVEKGVQGAKANLAKCEMEYRKLYVFSSRIYELAELKTEAEQNNDEQQIQEVTEELTKLKEKGERLG